MQLSSLTSFNLTPEFIQDHQLDPNVTPSDISEPTFRAFAAEVAWRDLHAMERVSYSDPTFRDMLATTRHTPADPPYRRARLSGPAHRIQTIPPEDLVYELDCSDGAVAFGRRALMTLRTAHRTGRINVRDCTTADVRSIVGGER